MELETCNEVILLAPLFRNIVNNISDPFTFPEGSEIIVHFRPGIVINSAELRYKTSTNNISATEEEKKIYCRISQELGMKKIRVNKIREEIRVAEDMKDIIKYTIVKNLGLNKGTRKSHIQRILSVRETNELSK